jgi:voltage-gated potassium channel
VVLLLLSGAVQVLRVYGVLGSSILARAADDHGQRPGHVAADRPWRGTISKIDRLSAALQRLGRRSCRSSMPQNGRVSDEAYHRLYLPKNEQRAPYVAILHRVAIALSVVLLNWLIVLLESDGYRDAVDGDVSVVDALYYTTVTLTTTGYGDITPVTTTARLINALVVTPMRLLFVLVLVGTTIQVLTQRSRDDFKIARWRSQVKDHIVVCGYGTKGRSAVRALLERGHSREEIVVVDQDMNAVSDATAAGFFAVHGSTTSDEVLREAVVDKARTVIVAVNRDDTAALTTLTVRQLARNVKVVAAIREQENNDLVRQSGADSVITSSDAAGRLLGLATDVPRTVHVIEDLMTAGHGLDIEEREVSPDEAGKTLASLGVPVLAVVRDGKLLHYNEPEVAELRPGDVIVYVASLDAGT